MLEQIFVEWFNNDSVMCGYFCVRFIDFMLKGKKLYKYIQSIQIYFYLIIMRRMINYY